MATQHTPGPWKVQPGSETQMFEVSSTSGYVAKLYELDAEAANARLIAAAPDLLHLFDDYPGYRAGQSTADYAARLGAWAINNEKNVQAAIAKVQGGAQ